MGLNASTTTNRAYVSIVQGKFARRVTAETAGAVKRIIEDKTTKAKREVLELIYDNVDGMIDSIEIKEDGKFGDQLYINMNDVGDKFTVQLSMAGREAKSFLCVLQNIDLQQYVMLFPYNFKSKEDGRQVIGLNIYQGGKTKEDKVIPFFSKVTPNGLPQVPEGSDKDEFKLVMKSQEIFLKKWAKKFIAENMAGEKTNYSASVNKMHPNPAAGGSFETQPEPQKQDDIKDDLPFRFDSRYFKIGF